MSNCYRYAKLYADRIPPSLSLISNSCLVSPGTQVYHANAASNLSALLSSAVRCEMTRMVMIFIYVQYVTVLNIRIDLKEIDIST